MPGRIQATGLAYPRTENSMFIHALKRSLMATSVALGLVAAGPAAAATDLIQNGGFEADGIETTFISGWSTFSDGIIGGVTTATGTASPISGYSTVGPKSGNWYGLLDSFQPSANALIQSFSTGAVTSAVLTFRLFVNDQGGTSAIHPSGLDYTTGGSYDLNQHVRIDILSASASPFDTGAGVVKSMYVLGDTGIDNPNPYQKFSFDLTSVLASGGSFQLRFAGVANQAALQIGVDDVALSVTAVPEPETYALMLAGLGLVGAIARRRKAA